jgi:hypothetical protein
MAKGRKGVFFTLIAVSLLGLVLFSYSVTYSYSLVEKSGVIETRVDTMNRFLGEVDSDMRNAIYISGFRALIGLEDYVSNTGTFVDSTLMSFRELFMNGTILGTNVSVMANNTFPYWIGKINEEANALGINISLNISEVDIYQVDPWSVRVLVNSTLVVSDSKATANWTQQKSLYSDILVVGFEDPFYAIYTGNNVVKRINMTVYDGNFTTVGTNTTNIRDHVAKNFYANFTGSPSFLMRFEGNFNSSIYGIESLVDKSEISPYHACPTETSSVDSIYWKCNNSILVKSVQNWTGFRIDNETGIGNGTRRIDRYMLGNYII